MARPALEPTHPIPRAYAHVHRIECGHYSGNDGITLRGSGGPHSAIRHPHSGGLFSCWAALHGRPDGLCRFRVAVRWCRASYSGRPTILSASDGDDRHQQQSAGHDASFAVPRGPVRSSRGFVPVGQTLREPASPSPCLRSSLRRCPDGPTGCRPRTRGGTERQ